MRNADGLFKCGGGAMREKQLFTGIYVSHSFYHHIISLLHVKKGLKNNILPKLCRGSYIVIYSTNLLSFVLSPKYIRLLATCNE